MDWDAKRIQANMGGALPIRIHGQNVQPNAPPGGVDPAQPSFSEAVRLAGKAARTEHPPEVHFSAHASQRLLQRGVSLDSADLAKISRGIDMAGEKGAKESLLILRDLALIVSVDNRTVITALQGDGAKDNVFTQIDSAVVLS